MTDMEFSGSFERYRDIATPPRDARSKYGANGCLVVAFSFIMATLSVYIMIYSPMRTSDFLAYRISVSIENATAVLGVMSALYIIKALRHGERRNPDDVDLSFRIKIIFVWCFGIGVAVQETVYFIIDVQCVKVDNFYWEPIVSRTVKFSFLLLQLGCITISKSTQIISTWKCDVAIFCIMLSNGCFWLKNTVKDVANIYRTNGREPGRNETNQTIPFTGPFCFWFSPIQEFLPDIEHCTIPMQFEFQLLATILFMRMRMRFLQPLRSGHLYPHEREMSAQGHGKYTFCTLIVCIVVFLPLTILNLFAKYILDYNGHGRELIKLVYILDAICSIASLILYVYGFHLLPMLYQTKYSKILTRLSNYVLIFTMASLISLYAMLFIAKLHTENDDIIMTCVECSIMLLDVFYQTIFIISFSNISLSDSIANGHYIFYIIFIFNGVFNLHMWLVNTFFDLRRHDSDDINSELVSANTWRLVKRVVFPFAIYFRFHSSMEFYTFYRKLVEYTR